MDKLHLILIALAVVAALAVLVAWIVAPSRRSHGRDALPASRPPRHEGAWDTAASRRRELA